jgi:hypothetical protein
MSGILIAYSLSKTSRLGSARRFIGAVPVQPEGCFMLFAKNITRDNFQTRTMHGLITHGFSFRGRAASFWRRDGALSSSV